ncbi:MAG: ion transporter [Gemmatimonadota bacterium]
MRQARSALAPPREGPAEQPEATPYQVFMLGLCCLVLFMLAVEHAIPLTSEEHAILLRVDLFVCAFFLLDFLLSVWKAPNRLRYLYTWGWLDLISSVPTLGVLQWGRAARMARVLRLLRGVRSLRKVVRFATHARRAETALLASILIAILVLTLASVGVLHVERAAGGSIRTASDAIWWSIVTATSVGYGDVVPITHVGRILAMMLMVAGIGLFGIYTAFLASWLIAPGEDEQERELEAIRHELQALRRELAERDRIREPDPQPTSLQGPRRRRELIEAP